MRRTKLPPSVDTIPRPLQDIPHWVVGRLVKVMVVVKGKEEERFKKVPYQARLHTQKADPTKPKTWSSFEEALQAYHKHKFNGIGFVFSKDDPFAGVDLDKCRNTASGELESWAQQIMEYLNSYTEVSPSGTGVHVLVQGTLPPGRRKKGQVEMYDQVRFFCMTGDHLTSTPTTIELRQAELEGLHAQVFGCAKKSDSSHGPTPHPNKTLDDKEVMAKVKGTKKGEALWSGDFSQFPSQSEADMALCGQLARLTNGDAQQIDQLFRQSALMRPKWDERHDADGHTYGAMTIANAVEGLAHHDNTNPSSNPKGNEVEKIIADINRTHAVVMVGGKCVILNEETDPIFGHKCITLSSPSDFKQYYGNRMITVKKKTVDHGTLWLKHKDRRQYEGIVMAPEQSTPHHYNLWQGFAVPSKEGNCSLYLDHLKWNIAQGDDEIYDYLIHWMAHTIQHPGNRVGVSIVLRGKQGTGKGVMCSQFGALFGLHFVHVQHSKHLVGHFNAHLKQAVLVFADEAFWAGDKAHEGALKAMVTEDQLPIEFKGKDVIYMKNHIHLLVASNHEWVVPAGLEERRFFVVDVGEAHMQDHAYFGKIATQMENGGREALLYFLMNRDLEGINLRTFPQTQALMENKLHSMSPDQQFWYEILMAGSLRDDQDYWQGWEIKDYLHEDFVKQAGKAGQRHRAIQTQLGIALNKLVPGLNTCIRTIDDKRVGVWEFPDLAACRRAFDQATNFDHDWPEESSARVSRYEKNGKS